MASSQQLDDEQVLLPYKRINQQCGNIWDFGEKPGQQTNKHLIQQSSYLLLMLQQYKMLCFSNEMLKNMNAGWNSTVDEVCDLHPYLLGLFCTQTKSQEAAVYDELGTPTVSMC